MTKEDYRNVCVSKATLREEDLIQAFTEVLEDLNPEKAGKLRKEYEDVYDALETALEEEIFPHFSFGDNPDLFEATLYLIEALADALEEEAPDGCYFGTLEGDSSCFGFWEEEQQMTAQKWLELIEENEQDILDKINTAYETSIFGCYYEVVTLDRNGNVSKFQCYAEDEVPDNDEDEELVLAVFRPLNPFENLTQEQEAFIIWNGLPDDDLEAYTNYLKKYNLEMSFLTLDTYSEGMYRELEDGVFESYLEEEHDWIYDQFYDVVASLKKEIEDK